MSFEEGPRVIKRYVNRKLYDTRESRYVTLQEIAVIVREGEDVKVIDNATKEDLTNVTLAQIIYEEEKRGESEAPKRSLMSFIQARQKQLVDSLPEPISRLLRDDKDQPLEKRDPEALLQELQGSLDDRARFLIASLFDALAETERRVETLEARVDALMKE